jgi:hypothetical protein
MSGNVLRKEDHLPFRERLRRSKERRKKRMKPLRKLNAREIDQLTYQAGTTVSIGRPLGGSTIKVGNLYDGPEGKRLVLKANGSSITFLADKYVYEQSTNDFAEDWIWTVGEKAARSARFSVAFSEGTVEFLMGFASVATGPVGVIASISSGAISFYSNNKDNFEKWYRILKAFWRVEEKLYKHAPKLWLIFNSILTTEVIKTVAKAAPRALLRILLKPGRLLGKMGGRLAMKSIARRFDAMKTIVKIVRDVALEFAKTLPGAIGESIGESIQNLEERVKQVVAALREAGIEIKPAEAQQILEEVANNAPVLRESLRDISTAFGYY